MNAGKLRGKVMIYLLELKGWTANISEAFSQVQTSDISLSVTRCCCFPLWHILQSACTAPLVRKNEELCKKPCCPSASPSPPSHEWQWLQREQGACIQKKRKKHEITALPERLTESSFRNGSVCAPTPCLSCSPQNHRPRLPANQNTLSFFYMAPFEIVWL